MHDSDWNIHLNAYHCIAIGQLEVVDWKEIAVWKWEQNGIKTVLFHGCEYIRAFAALTHKTKQIQPCEVFMFTWFPGVVLQRSLNHHLDLIHIWFPCLLPRVLHIGSTCKFTVKEMAFKTSNGFTSFLGKRFRKQLENTE